MVENTEANEQGLLLFLGSRADVKPELKCIMESSDVKTDVQPDHVSSFCKKIKVEKTDKDEQGLLMPLGITTDVVVLDVKPELKCIMESPDVKTDVQPDHVSSFCKKIKVEKTDKDEQSLLMPLGITTDVVVLDVKPELKCIMESPDVKTDVQPDHVSSFCKKIKVEKTDKDEQGLLMPLGITTDVVVLDVKPELKCNIKQENISKNIEQLNVNADVKSCLIIKSKSIGKDEGSDSIKKETATPDEPWQETKMSKTTERCDDMKLALEADRKFGEPLDDYVAGRNRNRWEPFEKANHGTNQKKTFSCTYCNEGFSYKSNLSRHLMIHTGEKPFCCTYCDKQFSDKRVLIKHLRIHTGEKPFCCTYCKKSFRDKSALTKHLRIHTVKSHLTTHLTTYTSEKPFSCTYCNKRFNVKSLLTNHLSIHTREKPFCCAYCNKRFNVKVHLTKHLRIHTGERPFCCTYCDKRFSSKSALNTHLRIHTGEKPFNCTCCDKRFSDKSALIAHLRIHTGEKPFCCTYCKKRFREKGTLTRHLRIHTGEKPFCCIYCDQRFNVKGNLTTHLMTHTGEKPFSCTYCDKRFNNKSHLTKHLRIHTGEKPFCCMYCNKLFSVKANLAKHLRIHTGEKPFYCASCDKRFSNKNALNTHLRIHTV